MYKQPVVINMVLVFCLEPKADLKQEGILLYFHHIDTHMAPAELQCLINGLNMQSQRFICHIYLKDQNLTVLCLKMNSYIQCMFTSDTKSPAMSMTGMIDSLNLVGISVV